MAADETGRLDALLRAGFRLETLVVSVVLSLWTASVLRDSLSTVTSSSVALAGAVAVAALELALFLWLIARMTD